MSEVTLKERGSTLESKGACALSGPGAKCGVRGAMREVQGLLQIQDTHHP